MCRWSRRRSSPPVISGSWPCLGRWRHRTSSSKKLSMLSDADQEQFPPDPSMPRRCCDLVRLGRNLSTWRTHSLRLMSNAAAPAMAERAAVEANKEGFEKVTILKKERK